MLSVQVRLHTTFYVRARRCLSRLALLAPTPRGSPRHSLMLAFEYRVERRREDPGSTEGRCTLRILDRVQRSASSGAPWCRCVPTGVG